MDRSWITPWFSMTAPIVGHQHCFQGQYRPQISCSPMALESMNIYMVSNVSMDQDSNMAYNYRSMQPAEAIHMPLEYLFLSPKHAVFITLALCYDLRWGTPKGSFPTESHFVHQPFLKPGPMPCSRWPIQNNLNGIFGGSLSYDALSEYFLTLWSFAYVMVFSLYGISCV